MNDKNSAVNRGVALLHNMSVAPRTVLRYKASKHRAYGKGITFQMPDALGSLGPAELLAILDKKRAVGNRPDGAKVTSQDAEAELRARIDAHALTLPFPPAAVVVSDTAQGDGTRSDLLTVLTVLAKSSSHVYLRDKEPNLASITPGRRVVLLLPPDGSTP